ncbi:DUF2268 domain-containing protein [Desertibacillus haloalkaliphilus]|uniref:DUF2268 domain-containing protein n=1 Tax=Desertibacillus haloalkaliphilus TaxID=1328930 RepID=UPI001C25FD21|nr:DUF2268 domain-containing protein [Desertibacillus haloalkaliphilus]MBU8906928.1 DUF2268 domain-containing protein [Desertibacillus haloalkaliphilus]
MGVIATNNWVREFAERCQKKGIFERELMIQKEVIIERLAKAFQTTQFMDLHEYLLNQGLFHPDHGGNIKEVVAHLEEKKCWQYVQEEYKWLRSNWRGPKASIFIFPVEMRNTMIMNELGGKMGIGFRDKIFLFLSPEVSKGEVCQLLTHEYHHVCRLSYLNKSATELSLLDSLLVEGLAEAAVGERFGEGALAPWVKRYNDQEVETFWERVFLPNLQLKGHENHQPFLYGNGSVHLPKWIGYCIGYKIVKSLLERHRGDQTTILLRLSSEEILQRSKFLAQPVEQIEKPRKR